MCAGSEGSTPARAELSPPRAWLDRRTSARGALQQREGSTAEQTVRDHPTSCEDDRNFYQLLPKLSFAATGAIARS
jgi:hypothetical protein